MASCAMLYSNPGHRWKEEKLFLIEGVWPGEEEEGPMKE